MQSLLSSSCSVQVIADKHAIRQADKTTGSQTRRPRMLTLPSPQILWILFVYQRYPDHCNRKQAGSIRVARPVAVLFYLAGLHEVRYLLQHRLTSTRSPDGTYPVLYLTVPVSCQLLSRLVGDMAVTSHGTKHQYLEVYLGCCQAVFVSKPIREPDPKDAYGEKPRARSAVCAAGLPYSTLRGFSLDKQYGR